MRTPSFYQTIIATLLAVMAVAAIGMIASCELIPAIAPDDWAWNPPAQDSIDIDTTQIDTVGTNDYVNGSNADITLADKAGYMLTLMFTTGFNTNHWVGFKTP